MLFDLRRSHCVCVAHCNAPASVQLTGGIRAEPGIGPANCAADHRKASAPKAAGNVQARFQTPAAGRVPAAAALIGVGRRLIASVPTSSDERNRAQTPAQACRCNWSKDRAQMPSVRAAGYPILAPVFSFMTADQERMTGSRRLASLEGREPVCAQMSPHRERSRPG
jgi:hypothetical protein